MWSHVETWSLLYLCPLWLKCLLNQCGDIYMTFMIVTRKTLVMLPTLPTLQLPSVNSPPSILSLSGHRHSTVMRWNMSIPQLKPSAGLVSGSSPLTHNNKWPDFHRQVSRKLQEAVFSTLSLPLSLSPFLLSAFGSALSCCASGGPWLTPKCWL